MQDSNPATPGSGIVPELCPRDLWPVLKGSKDLEWAQNRFASRPSDNLTGIGRCQQLMKKGGVAERILARLVKGNPDDTMPELFEKFTCVMHEAKAPGIAALPSGIGKTTFQNWLSDIAYPRGRTPTVRITKNDRKDRVRFSTDELSLPEHATDALFWKNSLSRSLAADGFQYDHHDVARKNPTGYVLRQGPSDLVTESAHVLLVFVMLIFCLFCQGF